MSNPYENVTKVEIGCDWLTMTLNHNNGDLSFHLDRLLAFEKSLLQDGHSQELSQWQGYSGRKTGSFFVGERADGYCVRVSGSAAASAFGILYRPDWHVSRLDLAVTVWLTPAVSGLGLDALQSARLAKIAGKVKNPATITHYEDDNGGFTLYIGKRTSAFYSRLYNKEAQSKDMYYEGAWRYELELHNQTASSTASELFYSLFPQQEAICSAVWSYYHGKGINPAFPTFPTGFEVVSPLKESTTVEKQLRWLETQVRPTVAELIRNGYTSSAMAALGLPFSDIGHIAQEAA